MRTSVKITGALALLAVGYALGASGALSPLALFAQGAGGKKAAAPRAEEPAAQFTDETKTKIRAAADALKAAMEALQNDGKHESAIKGINSFAVLSGGDSSLPDLKNGPVVDPETFAALYAGMASDLVVADLGRDAEQRLTYKNKVIRMYPVSAIRSRYALRAAITGEELLPTIADDSKPSKPKKKAEETEE